MKYLTLWCTILITLNVALATTFLFRHNHITPHTSAMRAPIVEHPTIYLTFDADMTAHMRKDALTKKIVWYDPALLSYLHDQHIPATFFVTGMFAELYPEVVKQWGADPLVTIGNHTYDHAAFTKNCYHLPIATDKTSEISKTQKILSDLTGATPKLFRYPGLCHTSTDDALVAELGLTVQDGNLVSGDAFSHNKKAIVKNILRHVHDGSIIVMHPGGPHAPETTAAVEELIPKLHAAGYNFSKL